MLGEVWKLDGGGCWARARARVVGRGWEVVASAVNRMPLESVNRNGVPGCGFFFRTMTRIPAGQPERSSMPVNSATHIPSRSITRGPRVGQKPVDDPEADEYIVCAVDDDGPTEVARHTRTIRGTPAIDDGHSPGVSQK